MAREITTIEGFLDAGRSKLKGAVPADRVNAILDEARAHMTDRRDDLVTSGMDPTQAESTAVVAFGDIGEWTRSIVDSAYIDGGARWATSIATASAAVFIIWPMIAQIRSLSTWPVIAPFLVASLALAAASARGRRYMPLWILGLGGVGAACLYFVCGSTQISIPSIGRVNTRSALVGVAAEQSRLQANLIPQIAYLRQGMQAFRPGEPAESIPSEFRDGAGFIAPYPQSAIQPGVPIQISDPTRTPKAIGLSEFVTLRDVDDAEQAWSTNAPAWLQEFNTMSAMDARENVAIKRALRNKHGFDGGAGLWAVIGVAVMTAVALLIHLAFAWAGRAAFRYRRRAVA